MKKLLLAVVLVLMLTVPAFAQIIGPVENGNGSMNNVTNQQVQATGGTGIGYGGHASVYAPNHSYNPQSQYNSITNNPTNINTPVAIGGQGGDANVNNDVHNTNVNINKPKFTNKNVIEEGAVQNDNTNIQRQGQLQGQLQGQDQTQNNEQTISPIQTVTIKTEKPFANIPSVGVPELNFGNGSIIKMSSHLPRFKGVTLLASGDTIHTIIDIAANVPFKKLYKTILKMARENAIQAPYLRFQVTMMEGQKSWTTGGSLAGGGTGLLGATGVAGGGSLIPSVGGTKAHPLFTIIAVNVVPE